MKIKIKTIPGCPTKILQSYQAGEDLGVDFGGQFEVKTKDKSFSTSIYPFLQSDHLVAQLKGRPQNKPFSCVAFWQYCAKRVKIAHKRHKMASEVKMKC